MQIVTCLLSLAEVCVCCGGVGGGEGRGERTQIKKQQTNK